MAATFKEDERLVFGVGQGFLYANGAQGVVGEGQGADVPVHGIAHVDGIADRGRVLARGELRQSEHLPLLGQHGAADHLVAQVHAQRVVVVLLACLVGRLQLAGREGAVFLRGIGQEQDLASYGRGCGGKGQGLHLLAVDGHAELGHIVHVIHSHDGLDGHLLAFAGDGYRPPCALEQAVVGQGDAVFRDEEAVAGLQYLVAVIVGDNGKHTALGFFHPLGGLRHAPLSQPTEEQRT